MNDDRDNPPIDCPCGCKETIKKGVYYEECEEVEYFLHCKACGTFLGHFSYGSWQY